jgi:hypothetical protein
MGGCFSSDEVVFGYFLLQQKVTEKPLFRTAKQYPIKNQQNHSISKSHI